MRTPETRRKWAVAAAILAAAWLVLGASRAGDPPVCAACHGEVHEAMVHTKHGNADDSRTPYGAGRACEACHGDATAHAEDPSAAKPGVTFSASDSVDAKNAACLSCHRGASQMHWKGSPHERARVACADCHDPHGKADQALVKETQAGVCFDCHKDVRADVFRASTHPIRTGWMTCSSCHNPHGSVADHQLVRNTVNETCYECHADKRGPFLWEHPPAREDCGNCHSPHGSNNLSMLKARGPYLCQQCHANPFHPSSLYSGNNLPPNLAADKMLGKNCFNCHSKVHGSNHPSGARLTR